MSRSAVLAAIVVIGMATGLVIALASHHGQGATSTPSGERFASPVQQSPPAPSGPASTGTADEAAKTADQIMSDAVSAMAQASSVHVSGSSTDDQGAAVVELDKTPDAARQTLMDSSPGAETLVVVGGKAYDARNGPFRELAPDVSAELQSLTLRSMVDCLRVEHGTYTKGAVTVVNRRRTISITDDGKAPGASPGTIFVAVDAPVEVVRVTVNGPVTAGGSGSCGHPLDAKVVSAAYDLDFSRPVAPITAPPVG